MTHSFATSSTGSTALCRMVDFFAYLISPNTALIRVSNEAKYRSATSRSVFAQIILRAFGKAVSRLRTAHVSSRGFPLRCMSRMRSVSSCVSTTHAFLSRGTLTSSLAVRVDGTPDSSGGTMGFPTRSVHAVPSTSLHSEQKARSSCRRKSQLNRNLYVCATRRGSRRRTEICACAVKSASSSDTFIAASQRLCADHCCCCKARTVSRSRLVSVVRLLLHATSWAFRKKVVTNSSAHA